MSTPDLDTIRDAYATATADDMYWHYEDYEADLEARKVEFDDWFIEHTRQKQEEAFDAAVEMFFGGTSTHDLMLTTNPYRKAQ